MSRPWLVVGTIYTLVIVAAIVVRFSAWGHELPDIVYSAAVVVSDFGTFPPYVAGIGVYVGQYLASLLQDMTGLADPHLLLSSVAWLTTGLGAVTVAVADVYLARWGWRLIARTCRRDRSTTVPI